MSYDGWKTNAPDPGSGSDPDWRVHSFWRNFDYAKEHGTLDEFFAYFTEDLPGHRHLVQLAKELAADALAVKK